jgi:hypothetical protein
MKIRVKHKETEFIVEDDGLRTDTNHNLIYYNSDYIIKLLKEITEHITNLNQEQKNGVPIGVGGFGVTGTSNVNICNNFIQDRIDSSETKCLKCGRERYAHPQLTTR